MEDLRKLENRLLYSILSKENPMFQKVWLSNESQTFLENHYNNTPDEHYHNRLSEIHNDFTYYYEPVSKIIDSIKKLYEKKETQKLLYESHKENFNLYTTIARLEDIVKNNTTKNFQRIEVSEVINNYLNRELTDYKFPDRFGLDTYLYRNNVNLIGAYSGVGKTYFVLNLILDMILNKQPVLFFSLEMTTDTLIRRLIQLYAYQSDKLKLNWIDTIERNKINPYIKSDSLLSQSVKQYLTIIDQSFLTSNDICNLSKQYIYQNKNKPIVFLDYIQIVSSANTKDDRRNAMINIMQDFVSIAKDNELILVLLSQTNRTSKENPTITSFSESSILEQASGLCITLNKQDHQTDFPIMQFNIVKNRFGKKHSNWVNWINECGYINGVLTDKQKLEYDIETNTKTPNKDSNNNNGKFRKVGV